jgi:hypothetical protein
MILEQAPFAAYRPRFIATKQLSRLSLGLRIGYA